MNTGEVNQEFYGVTSKRLGSDFIPASNIEERITEEYIRNEKTLIEYKNKLGIWIQILKKNRQKAN